MRAHLAMALVTVTVLAGCFSSASEESTDEDPTRTSRGADGTPAGDCEPMSPSEEDAATKRQTTASGSAQQQASVAGALMYYASALLTFNLPCHALNMTLTASWDTTSSYPETWRLTAGECAEAPAGVGNSPLEFTAAGDQLVSGGCIVSLVADGTDTWSYSSMTWKATVTHLTVPDDE